MKRFGVGERKDEAQEKKETRYEKAKKHVFHVWNIWGAQAGAEEDMSFVPLVTRAVHDSVGPDVGEAPLGEAGLDTQGATQVVVSAAPARVS